MVGSRRVVGPLGPTWEKAMRKQAPLEEGGPEAGRSRAVAQFSVSLDVPLVIYGLTTGVLAVGACALVTRADQQLGALTKIISLLVTVTIVVAASLFGDSLLRWLLPLPWRSHRTCHS